MSNAVALRRSSTLQPALPVARRTASTLSPSTTAHSFSFPGKTAVIIHAILQPPCALLISSCLASSCSLLPVLLHHTICTVCQATVSTVLVKVTTLFPPHKSPPEQYTLS